MELSPFSEHKGIQWPGQLPSNTASPFFGVIFRCDRSYGARFRTTPGEASEGDHTQVIGTADGTITEFTATLLYPAIEPGSVSVTDELEVFADSDNGTGTGTLTGSAGGTGTINYTTGAITVNFNTAPAPTIAITASYVGQRGNAVPSPGQPS